MADNGTRDFLADRLNAGENVGERADAIGIHRRTLQSIEKAPAVMPSVRVAKRVADFYGVAVLDIWPPPAL